MNAHTASPRPNHPETNWLAPAASLAPSANSWSSIDRGDDLPASVLVDTLTVGDTPIPIWQVVDSEESVPDGKFVCYRDMPAELATAFREQQVLAGHPFAGTAYIEDFLLFIELRRC